MKKIILLAAFGAVGLVSANTGDGTKIKLTNKKENKEYFRPLCRKFTVQVSIGIVSVSTDVIACIEFNEYGGPKSITFSKNGIDSNSADITDAIQDLQKRSGQANISEIELVGSVTQTYDNGSKIVIEEGKYTVSEKGGNYYFNPTLSEAK